ncbi:hypothetical protein BGX29_005770 [Mortierella sp. GBA35]|nr:hypothetical protein BGX29_005770 [Mortierella sp. GBA35]
MAISTSSSSSSTSADIKPTTTLPSAVSDGVASTTTTAPAATEATTASAMVVVSPMQLHTQQQQQHQHHHQQQALLQQQQQLQRQQLLEQQQRQMQFQMQYQQRQQNTLLLKQHQEQKQLSPPLHPLQLQQQQQQHQQDQRQLNMLQQHILQQQQQQRFPLALSISYESTQQQHHLRPDQSPTSDGPPPLKRARLLMMNQSGSAAAAGPMTPLSVDFASTLMVGSMNAFDQATTMYMDAQSTTVQSITPDQTFVGGHDFDWITAAAVASELNKSNGPSPHPRSATAMAMSSTISSPSTASSSPTATSAMLTTSSPMTITSAPVSVSVSMALTSSSISVSTMSASASTSASFAASTATIKQESTFGQGPSPDVSSPVSSAASAMLISINTQLAASQAIGGPVSASASSPTGSSSHNNIPSPIPKSVTHLRCSSNSSPLASNSVVVGGGNNSSSSASSPMASGTDAVVPSHIANNSKYSSVHSSPDLEAAQPTTLLPRSRHPSDLDSCGYIDSSASSVASVDHQYFDDVSSMMMSATGGEVQAVFSRNNSISLNGGSIGMDFDDGDDDSDPENSRPAICPHCLKEFQSKGLLRSHIVSHSSDRPFVCRDCSDKSYKRNHDLLRHRREKHNVEGAVIPPRGSGRHSHSGVSGSSRRGIGSVVGGMTGLVGLVGGGVGPHRSHRRSCSSAMPILGSGLGTRSVAPPMAMSMAGFGQGASGLGLPEGYATAAPVTVASQMSLHQQQQHQQQQQQQQNKVPSPHDLMFASPVSAGMMYLNTSNLLASSSSTSAPPRSSPLDPFSGETGLEFPPPPFTLPSQKQVHHHQQHQPQSMQFHHQQQQQQQQLHAHRRSQQHQQHPLHQLPPQHPLSLHFQQQQQGRATVAPTRMGGLDMNMGLNLGLGLEMGDFGLKDTVTPITPTTPTILSNAMPSSRRSSNVIVPMTCSTASSTPPLSSSGFFSDTMVGMRKRRRVSDASSIASTPLISPVVATMTMMNSNSMAMPTTTTMTSVSFQSQGPVLHMGNQVW